MHPERNEIFYFRKYMSLLFAVLILLTYSNAESQVNKKNKPGIGKDLSSDFSAIFHDGVSFYTIPFRFSTEDWLFTLGGAGVVAGLMPLDYDVKKAVTGNNGNGTKSLWTIGRDYGDLKYTGTASILLYTTGLLIRQKEIRITGRMLLQSLLYAGILTSGMKFVTGRSRPYITSNQYQFNWFETNNDMLSFPSGHSTVAFAVSTVLAEKIDKWWARVVLYSLAASTAYSRIYDNQHWLTDVVVGSAIGFGAGYFTVHSEKSRNKNNSKFSDKINMYLTLRGVNLVYKL